jgi:glutathione S-transferase
LYGFHPDADRRPEALRQAMETVYDFKLMALEALLAANPGEPALQDAVRAKMAKERGGRKACKDAGFQRAARERTAETLAGLERDVASRSFDGLVRGGFSLADVLWGVNLVRMNYLGLAPMWDGLPHVQRYFAALVRRPSLASETVRATVRSMPPSAAMDAIATANA